MSPFPLVHIHYLRPPDRTEIFTQHLLWETPAVKVTLARDVPFDPPIRILGETALEKGSDAVWFTFPGMWHDIGRFHRADGTFTGLYANILTPPIMEEETIWHTTDLFLDVWVDRQGQLSILDEDQFREGMEKGVVSPQDGERAMEEVRRIQRMWEEGAWPPPVVEEWTLETCLRTFRAG